jgi:hypothetical protein
METTENIQNETDVTPYEQICPRHGARIRQRHGCPKCVIEEVRRHESRVHISFKREVPVPPDSIDEAGSMDLRF